MKQPEQTPSEIRCKNCGGNYDPSAPNCPFCGEDTARNTATASTSLLDEAKYGGGFGEHSTLRKLMSAMVGVLVVAFLVGAVWLGMDAAGGGQPAELDNPNASSSVSGEQSSVGAESSAGLPADPDASQTAPEQSAGSSQTAPEQSSQTTPEQPSQTDPEPDLSIATGLTISAISLSLEEGGSKQLTATVAPEGWTGSVIWSSSDQSVATVDATGKVTYVSGGSCTITAEAGDLTQTCAVQCAEAAPSDLLLYYTYRGERYTDVTLNNVGDGFVLEVSGGTGTYQWSTSNAAVATVSDGGSVYATGSGRCTITVTSGNASASVSVRVK